MPLKSIQIMFDELREKLLALNIRTNFSDIQEDALLKVCSISEKTSVIEKIMLHVQNIVTILIKLQNKGDCDTNDAQNKEILNVLELARNILYYARVVEGKLDVATDCRDQFGHIRLHDLSSRQNILDAVEAVNMLIPQLEKLSNQLKAVGIEEELSFSLYGPLELAYIENYFDISDDKDTWFNKMKDLSEEKGYSREVKAYKQEPEKYKGHVGDISTVIRVALTTKCNTPDLYEIMQVLGKDTVENRIKRFIETM